MPTISGKTTIAAGATNANILQGSQYEFSPFDGTIEFGIVGDRVSATLAMFSGPDTLQEPGGFVPFSGTAGTQGFPRYPDDYHWEDEVAAGDRLKVTVVNGDGANALVVNWALRLTAA
jgi:hypothetical protein